MRRILALSPLVLLARCAVPPPVPSAPPPATPAPAIAAPPAPRRVQELASQDFEADAPPGWFFGGEGYGVAIDGSTAHEGSHSLRMAYRAPGHFGVSTFALDAAPARGRQIVLGGWLKTDDVASGYAGLWLRLDDAAGKMLTIDNMSVRGVRGTSPWTRYEIAMVVPVEASKIVLGSLLTGTGTAWVDDVNLAVNDVAGTRPVSIAGVARDAAGKPVGDAIVALVAPGWTVRPEATTRTAADGHFAFAIANGRYAVTATAPGLAAAYRPVEPFDTPAAGVDVTLGGPAFTLKGTVRVDGSAPAAGTKVIALRASDVEGDIFCATTDPTGAFSLTLPPARGYTLQLDEADLDTTAPSPSVESRDQEVALAGHRRRPAPDAVVAWIRQTAIPIATTDPTHGVDDLERLGSLVGDAHVVGLGEATHGSREFFQLKHRVLEYLVERRGFTVFAIEANYPESLAVDDYVLHGAGNPRRALAGMYFWTWDTEEVLAQIEWMRRWNADPKHTKKLRFVGFDMQTAQVGVGRVIEYLTRVDPVLAKAAAAALGPLDHEHEPAYARLPSAQREATARGIADLVAAFDRDKRRWVARTSLSAWSVARQHAVVVAQAEHQYGHRDDRGWRDASMASNARWILDQEPKGARMVVWAHNAHVSLAESDAPPMGSDLARALGPDYLAVGFLFDRGAFQAHGRSFTGAWLPLDEHRVGEVPVGYAAEAFHRAGVPLLALDLRHPPAGEVASWLAEPHAAREVGATFVDESMSTLRAALPQRFHAVIYVDETTRARPNLAPHPP